MHNQAKVRPQLLADIAAQSRQRHQESTAGSALAVDRYIHAGVGGPEPLRFSNLRR